jgi:hypothetical protein
MKCSTLGILVLIPQSAMMKGQLFSPPRKYSRNLLLQYTHLRFG